MTRITNELKASYDHLTPRSRGGSLASDNLVRCCRGCNANKGNLTLEEYRLVVCFRAGKLSGATDALRQFRFHGERAIP